MAGKGTVNFYEILSVTRESSEKEIVRAFRKKALICHPDKNPDNPRAAELFHDISEALKVLTDKKAKAAYDAVLKAKELAKLRTQALDSKRKKFKKDLEARETSAQKLQEEDQNAKRNLEEEIKRLREEGSRLLQEQQELIKSQIKEDEQLKRTESITPKIKVKWKCPKDDHHNGGYNEEVLRTIFEKYGPVIDIIVSMKKNGLGIVEFKQPAHAVMALEFEYGLEDNPFTISWLQGPKKSERSANNSNNIKATSTEDVCSKVRDTTVIKQSIDEDFETSVLKKMKIAQKSKITDLK